MKQNNWIHKMLCIALAIGLVFAGNETWTLEAHAAELGTAGNVDVLEVELMNMSDVKIPENHIKTALFNCQILHSHSAAGLHVEITTSCANGTASYLGVKDIKVEQKVWYGWKTIATGSGAQHSNCSTMGLEFDYANVTVGETYRISCVHYGDYDGYHELSNQTSEFVFNY